jgi:hypothetical protein
MDRSAPSDVHEDVISPEDLAAQWLVDYERESFLENGDPGSFVERLRAFVEERSPGSLAARALPLFLESLEAGEEGPS